MLYKVMDDERNSHRADGHRFPKHRSFHPPWSGTGLTLLTLAAVATWSGHAAIAQQGAGAGAFQATVVDLAESSQRVTVPLFGSVTVETTVEVTRADVVAGQVADVQILSPKRLLIQGKGYGTTTIVLLGQDDQQHVFEVSVELDLQRLNDSIKEVDPQSDAQARSVLGNIILTGTVSGADRAQRIVELAGLFLPPSASGKDEAAVQNHLQVAGEQQVLLRCVVAEVNRSSTKELGINGYLIGENFRDFFMVNQLAGINPVNVGAAAGAQITQNVPFFTDEDGLVLRETPTLSLGFPRAQMQLFLKAMADNSLLKILAEPNLVAISGETATFLAGGEFPIPVPQGNQQVTIEFREFGVRLNFTPVVSGHQRIRLRVAPEVSELDFSVAVQIEGFVVPGLTTRATETTVELGNGETIAIAGLLNEQVRGLASSIPGMGDLPVLGALFRSVQYRRSLTELVILVTPEIVAPLDAHQKFALPGDEIKDPTSFQLYALGLLEGQGGPAGSMWPFEMGTQPETGAPQTQPDELSVHGPWGHAQPGDVQ
ncbi:MAG: type II and III secretion system protein family protein [Phycisphaerae bacterium]|jgi:pilus assembly protein CpaC